MTQDPNPYPHKFNVSIGIPAFIEKYTPIITEKGQRLDNETVSTRKATRSARKEECARAHDFFPSFPLFTLFLSAGHRRRKGSGRPRRRKGSRLLRSPLGGKEGPSLVPLQLKILSVRARSSPPFPSHPVAQLQILAQVQ